LRDAGLQPVSAGHGGRDAAARGAAGRPCDPAHEPFNLQCFYAAPFAISVSVAVVLVGAPAEPMRLAGAGLGLAGGAWYLCVQTRWICARLAVGPVPAFRTAALADARGPVLCLLATPC
jgi:hypothetical protein